MDEKSTKPKKIGNHYIPPPARKQGIGMNEATRHKERPMKTCENRGVKLCNDSSLLFKESNDKVKEKSRRPRRSKRTAKKADAENASILGENEGAEPKPSSTAVGLTDRIINCQSDMGSDMSVVIVEKPIIKAALPLIGPENMKPRHPDDLDAIDDSGEDDNKCKLLKPVHSTDQVITNVYEEVKNQLQSMDIFPSSYHRPTDVPENEENEHERLRPIYSSHRDIVDISEKVENQFTSLNHLHSRDLRTKDTLGEESHVTILKNSLSIDFHSHEPEFSLLEEGSSNIYRENCDDTGTSSRESIDKCNAANSGSENDKSSCVRKTECLKQSDRRVNSESTRWTETSINRQIHRVEDGDWESIYDDRGDCLLSPAGSVDLNLSEVNKNNVKMKASNTKKLDDDDDQPHETSSVIEIYGFSEDLKTNDIMTAFGNWTQRGFNLKWVDNTHALGIFPTPALAEEVLGSNIPLVKIRPISQGTSLSQERARTLVLPSSLRPKTCTALARRLVSGALGLRVNVTPEERAAERELLREAREKKKLVLKQRDAAWEGNFSSLESSEEKASN